MVAGVLCRIRRVLQDTPGSAALPPLRPATWTGSGRGKPGLSEQERARDAEAGQHDDKAD